MLSCTRKIFGKFHLAACFLLLLWSMAAFAGQGKFKLYLSGENGVKIVKIWGLERNGIAGKAGKNNFGSWVAHAPSSVSNDNRWIVDTYLGKPYYDSTSSPVDDAIYAKMGNPEQVYNDTLSADPYVVVYWSEGRPYNYKNVECLSPRESDIGRGICLFKMNVELSAPNEPREDFIIYAGVVHGALATFHSSWPWFFGNKKGKLYSKTTRAYQVGYLLLESQTGKRGPYCLESFNYSDSFGFGIFKASDVMKGKANGFARKI